MRGGFRAQSKRNAKAHQISFTTFALDTITSSVIESLKTDKDRFQRATFYGGNGNDQYQGVQEPSFVDKFVQWIKIEADPKHDFKGYPIHTGYDKRVLNDTLIRPYQQIFEKHTNAENNILLSLLEDLNTPHGISLKFCRFYAIAEEQDIPWHTIEANFASVNRHYDGMYYLVNSGLTGARGISFSDKCKKMTPLPVRWDSISGGHIDFTVGIDNAASNEFFDILYTQVNIELFNATGIGLLIREHRGTNPVTTNITVVINGQAREFHLSRKGFKAPELRTAIQNIIDGTRVTLPVLSDIVDHLKAHGKTDMDIVSFLLTCKMSGDVGTVLFLKQLGMYAGKVYLKDGSAPKTSPPVEKDFDVVDKPLLFMCTSDRLCAANAVINDVLCVYTCSIASSKYVCQFMGSTSGFYVDAFMQPYYDTIDAACVVAKIPPPHTFRTLNDQEKALHLPNIYKRLYEVLILEDGSTLPALVSVQTPDDFVRYTVAISALLDFETRLQDSLKKVVASHLRTLHLPTTMLHLDHVNTINTYYKKHGFFDPFLQYFKDAIIVPDAGLQRHLYNHIRKRLFDGLKLALTDNIDFLNGLRDRHARPLVSRSQTDFSMIDASANGVSSANGEGAKGAPRRSRATKMTI